MSFKKKITNYINSGYPVLLIQTSEERRLNKTLFDITQSNSNSEELTQFWNWSITKGWTCANENVMEFAEATTPQNALQTILLGKMAEDSLMVITGFDMFLQAPEIIQLVKDLVQFCKVTGRTVVFVSHANKIPDALKSHITITDFNLPTDIELEKVLKSVISGTKGIKNVSKEILNQAVESALGMTEFEAENAFALSLVEAKKIVPEIIRREKAQVIKKSGLLEYYEPNATMGDVGGLELLKSWINRTGKAFTHSIEAKEYGLPALNGIINVGPPGCGKSLLAKAISKEWNLSLLRFDVSKIFGSLVGESEGNTRETLKLAEAMSPCVTGETKIELSNGDKITAMKLYNMSEKGEKPELKGYNFETGEIKAMKLHTVIRRPAFDKKLIEVKCDEGQKVKVTENHKFLVERDGKKIFVEAKNLCIGDDMVSY